MKKYFALFIMFNIIGTIYSLAMTEKENDIDKISTNFEKVEAII